MEYDNLEFKVPKQCDDYDECSWSAPQDLIHVVSEYPEPDRARRLSMKKKQGIRHTASSDTQRGSR